MPSIKEDQLYAQVINIDDVGEVLFWTAKLRCTTKQLRSAVQSVGPNVAAVREYLSAHTSEWP